MAYVLFWLTFAGLICQCFSTQRQTQPGIRLRVTNKGLQYADDVGIKVLLKRLRKEQLNDISHKDGGTEFRIYGIKNNRASIASSSFSTVPGQGLTLRASGIDLAFSGNVHYKKKIGWFTLSDTVRFSLETHGIGFSLTVRIGSKSNGRPTISTERRDCSSHVDSVKVKFHGDKGWLYNLFSGVIDRRVKGELKKMICKEAREAINEDGAKILASFPVVRNISHVAQIDYSLVGNPKFTSSYMDVSLKGEFKPAGNPRTSVPFTPAALPAFTEVDKMVYIWLTDYVFNTASIVYHKQGALRTVITSKDLPKKSKYLLNTKTFEMLLPQLYQKYPDSQIFIKFYTTKAPVFTSSINRTKVTVSGNAEIHVTAKNGADMYALTLGLRSVLDGSLGVKYGNLTFHAKSFRNQVRLVRSAIGDIKLKVKLLQIYLNHFVHTGRFLAQLNVIGDRGFPLPMIPDITWEDTNLTTGEGYTLIKTNLRYRARRLR